MVKKNAARGGKPCPKKLVQRRRCRENPPCINNSMKQQRKFALIVITNYFLGECLINDVYIDVMCDEEGRILPE